MAPTFNEFIPGGHTPDDLRDRARELLPPDVFAHVLGGAGDERTVAANRAGFGRYRLLPRALIDVADVETGVEILGTRLAAPIFTCPTGGIGLVHPDCERTVARAAATAEVGFILNAWTYVTMEEVARAAGPSRWYQLYWQGNRKIMADLVRRAETAGYRAIVLTVDTPVGPRRRRMLRNGFTIPSGVESNLAGYAAPEWEETEPAADLALTWSNVEWLRSVTRGPLVIKGLMSPADAERAIEVGADAVMISNHGGRNLDSLPGTIEVLEDVVAAVHGRVPVLIDGGFRRASDIAIALGLGAAAVGIGSPVVWALACGGEDLVAAYLEDLVSDLAQHFRMLGVTSVAGMTRDRVSAPDRYVPDSALIPFLPPA